MHNVDIEIYLNQFKSFFNNNPKELKNLIGDADKIIFYQEVEKQVIKNSEQGPEFELTQKQIIDIIVKMNDVQAYMFHKSFDDTKFGKLFLN